MIQAGTIGKVIATLARLLVGGVFMLSGFVKAVDPMGTAFKIQDYLSVADMEWLFPAALPMGIILNTVEFVLGFAIVLGIARRPASWMALLMMLFFTPLTLYIALTNPVPHCGCFGDAWVITNWQTFFKNVLLLTASVIVFQQRLKAGPLNSPIWTVAGLGMSTLIIVGLTFHALLYLPLIDFRPWKIGNHITSLLQAGTPPVVEHTFIYQHIQSGELMRIAEANLMSEGVPNPEEWRFLDRDRRVLDPGIPAVIQNFSIHDDFGEEVTELYINAGGDLLIVVAYDLQTTRLPAFIAIQKLADSAADHGIPLIALTSSPFEKANAFADQHHLALPFYQSDDRALKTMIRSNPGLILLRDGTVTDKWPHRRIPATWEEIGSDQ